MNNKTKFILFTLYLILFIFSFLFAENEMELIAELEGEHCASEFGFWSTALDFNGDGFDDLVVAARYWDPEYPGFPADPWPWGKIYFYFGKEEGFGDSVDMTLSHWDQDMSTAGYLENLGDMNGDGYEDLGYYANCSVTFCDTAYYNVNILFGSSEPDTIPDQTFTFTVGE